MKTYARQLGVVAFSIFSLMVPAVADETTPVPDKAAAAAASNQVPQGGIEVARLVLTKSVVDREPAEEITTAQVGDSVVAWSQIRSGLGPVTVTFRWLHENENRGDVPLDVKSSPWRTWSRKTVAAPGQWKVQILNSEGSVLKEAAFTVTEASAAAPQ